MKRVCRIFMASIMIGSLFFSCTKEYYVDECGCISDNQEDEVTSKPAFNYLIEQIETNYDKVDESKLEERENLIYGILIASDELKYENCEYISYSINKGTTSYFKAFLGENILVYQIRRFRDYDDLNIIIGKSLGTTSWHDIHIEGKLFPATKIVNGREVKTYKLRTNVNSQIIDITDFEYISEREVPFDTVRNTIRIKLRYE